MREGQGRRERGREVGERREEVSREPYWHFFPSTSSPVCTPTRGARFVFRADQQSVRVCVRGWNCRSWIYSSFKSPRCEPFTATSTINSPQKHCTAKFSIAFRRRKMYVYYVFNLVTWVMDFYCIQLGPSALDPFLYLALRARSWLWAVSVGLSVCCPVQSLCTHH